MITGVSKAYISNICLPAWGVFMSAAQSGRIDAFLKRAHKCGFSKELLTVNELLVEAGRVIFKKIKSPTHCLHMLLPPNKKIGLQP